MIDLRHQRNRQIYLKHCEWGKMKKKRKEIHLVLHHIPHCRVPFADIKKILKVLQVTFKYVSSFGEIRKPVLNIQFKTGASIRRFTCECGFCFGADLS